MEWRALVRDCQMACEGAVADAKERAETLPCAPINGKLRPRPSCAAIDVGVLLISSVSVLCSVCSLLSALFVALNLVRVVGPRNNQNNFQFCFSFMISGWLVAGTRPLASFCTEGRKGEGD